MMSDAMILLFVLVLYCISIRDSNSSSNHHLTKPSVVAGGLTIASYSYNLLGKRKSKWTEKLFVCDAIFWGTNITFDHNYVDRIDVDSMSDVTKRRKLQK
jgi:hypothetical protein